MLLLSPAGNQDVIQIGEDEGNAPKNTVHQPLECQGGILKPEGHAEELLEPEGVMMAVLGMSADATRIWW